MKRTALVFIAILLTVGVAWTAYGEEALPPPKRLTTKHMMADLKHAYTMLLQHHPHFKENDINMKSDWIDSYNYYLQLIKQASDEEQFKQVIQIMLNDLRDGDTRLLAKDEYDNYYDHCENVQQATYKDELEKMSAKRRYAHQPTNGSDQQHMHRNHHQESDMHSDESDLHMFTLPNSGYVLRIPN
ncbi:hypothetical protein NQ117_09440 [Paenibacillus sp. SC116]|uniref:hypothetical protein n=1 Tax=Paenibacillus sp. SC116 TaxID=2968986 RepID=UPI00215AA9D5|nr:hypothetical protein [Paenibacillus sp. SC116]MCR8843910.1 hypothetical protein [Paenibacillus sp. SC116]